MKKTLKIVLQVLFGILVLALILFFFRLWQIKSGRIIKLENGTWMTRTDFIKLYPPEGTIVPDKNTPFDTYDQFYALIQKGDYDNAVLLIDDGDKNRRINYLSALQAGGERMEIWKKDLPQKLDTKEIEIKGNFATYHWNRKDNKYHSIEFSKGQDGLWKIDNI